MRDAPASSVGNRDLPLKGDEGVAETNGVTPSAYAARFSNPKSLCTPECGGVDEGRPGWKMEHADLDEVAAYCPECWEREFGD